LLLSLDGIPSLVLSTPRSFPAFVALNIPVLRFRV
jgi:hypothetical protein